MTYALARHASRWLLITALAALLTLTAAGCDGGGDDHDDSHSQEDATHTPAPTVEAVYPTTPEDAAALFGGEPARWRAIGSTRWQLQEHAQLTEITLPNDQYCITYWDNFHDHQQPGPAVVIAAYGTIRYAATGFDDCTDE